MTTSEEFRLKITKFYHSHRRDLPWRDTTDPYQILVSEIMLQQTQVERVRDKYARFLSRFPDVESLARATVEEVLGEWQGLGYNRRALALKKAAVEIVERFGGILPDDEKNLRSLPGVGPYTAAAILAFAFNRPVVLIETNIRRVFIHCFFRDRTGVSDEEILPLIQQTLDREHPREWYNALMDYGWHLGTTIENPNRRSRHYSRQAPFEGSNRQLRGKILRMLVDGGELETGDLCRNLDLPASAVDTVLSQLETEGFIIREGDRVRIV
ncbi:MAG: ArsR family transcriptional regulator [Methanomicrobiales archaeon]|nr:ArsR family transcriptional regulator [Methanomicrobiales archaeon]